MLILMLACAYLIGSVSAAIIVSKLFNLPDPREQGSNNPGATNVLRIGGKLPALLTLFGDALKGALPVLIGRWLNFKPFDLAFVAIFVLVGHMFPIFHRFKGGKGVATSLGCFAVLSWPLAVLLLTTWLIVFFIFRLSSLSALCAALVAPVYGWFLLGPSSSLQLVAMSGLVLIRHKQNIIRLITSSESKL